MFASFSLLYKAACIVVQWSKEILKSVILTSWQIEKLTRQAKVQILWAQLVRNKTSFFFIVLSNLYATVSSQEALLLIPVCLQENICNYQQETGKTLVYIYSMFRSSHREELQTPHGGCLYLLLNSLHWILIANINLSYYFVIFFIVWFAMHFIGESL